MVLIGHKGGESIKKLIITTLLLFFCIIFLSGAVSAATINLNPSDSIQEKINTASPGDTLNLSEGSYNQSDINVTKNLTITGPETTDEPTATIDAKNNARIFNIFHDVNVTLKWLTITNGCSTGTDQYGGGIFNNGTLTMTNCNIINNTATSTSTTNLTAYGGGIYNNGTLIMTNCKINNNTASSITSTSSTYVNLESCGGGIYNNGGNLTMTNCDINNNIATTITTTIINYPFTVAYGGGIYVNSGNLTMTNCNINNNIAKALTTVLSYVDAYGGGIFTKECTTNMNNCTIANNMVIANNTITDAFAYAGGFYNGGNLTMTNCNINNNTANATIANAERVADAVGGGIVNANLLFMTYCNINNNIATATVTNGWVISARGAGIFNGKIMTLNSCNITNNTATATGAEHSYATYSGIFNGYTLIMNSCNIINNTATATSGSTGGGIGNNYKLTMLNCNIINNTATIGGGIYNRGSEMGENFLTVNFCRIVGNSIPTIYNYAMFCIPVVNLEDNWWGSNDPDFGSLLLDFFGIPFSPTNWLYLNVNATPNSVDNGATSQIIASFNNRYNGRKVTPFEPIGINHIPDVPVQLDIHSWGSFPGNLQTIILDTVNGAITPITYYANGGQPTPTSVIINGTTDGYTTNGTASATLTINKVMNLTVTKTGPETVIAGNQITYTITVENTGLDSAENVVIIDNISPILESVTHDDFNLGTIAVGTSKTVHINGTVPSSTIKGTVIENNATVTSTTSGIITPSIIVSTTVDTLVDVDLNKTVNNTRPDVGNSVTFIVTAHNYGPSDANNIQIQDMMPSDFANISIIPSKGNYDPGTGIWTLNLTSGEEAFLNLTGTVTAIMAGKNTTNTANITSQTELDPDTFDTANATIYVPKADLYIQITSDNNNPTVGETFTIRYKLGNKGPDDALNVTITIPIPDGFVISKIEGDGNWTIVGNNIIWTFNNVTVGDPDLYVSGWTRWAGSFLFGASITSDTFNLNSLGVSSLSLTTQPQVNAASETSNTIGMQNTGVPIAPLAIAVLSILGGLMTTRKKQ